MDPDTSGSAFYFGKLQKTIRGYTSAKVEAQDF